MAHFHSRSRKQVDYSKFSSVGDDVDGELSYQGVKLDTIFFYLAHLLQ